MSREYRDSAGMSLRDYERPSVAVDTAVLTFDPDVDPRHLLVLQVRRDTGPGWALPGTFLHEKETLVVAVKRSLRDKANVRGISPRQLHVFDRLNRDPRGWVLSVGHVAVVRPNQLAKRFPDRTQVVPVSDPGDLAYDHREIIERAMADLRLRYEDRPDPDGLLGDTFTLRDLRRLHDAVRGNRLGPDKVDTFRRRMREHLEKTDDFDPVEGRGRPARLYTHAPP